MLENLVKLHNTLGTVETKGESTKTMCDCLRFLEQMIAEASEAKVTANKKEEE